MRKKAILAGAAAAVLAAGVAHVVVRPAAPTAVAAPAGPVVSAPAAAAGAAAPAPAAPAPRSRPLPDVDIAPPPALAAIPVQKDFRAPSTVHASPVFPAPATSVLGGRDVMDPDDLAMLLHEFGGWSELYKAATADERGDLIVALDMGDGVRTQIEGLLPAETDSDLRAMMISRTDPEGFFDEGAEDAPVDEELVALLRAESATPVGREEWIARMQVAALAQEEFGVEMTRKAIAGHPDDAEVRLWASVLQLTLNRMVEGVSPQEVAAAEGFLYSRLASDSAGFSAQQRIQGYGALVFSSDPMVARDFLKDRMESETDAQARAALQQLVSALDRIAG